MKETKKSLQLQGNILKKVKTREIVYYHLFLVIQLYIINILSFVLSHTIIHY